MAYHLPVTAPPENLAPLVRHALRIAREAGEKILEVYGTDFEVETKDDDSPLTRADLASHRHILNELTRIQPQLPIISEESADVAYEKRASWPRYWLVDPLDGTREFVKRNGEFTVNIALIDGHRPILGVVHAPALGVTFAAAQGRGAFRQDGKRRVRIRTRPLASPPVFVVSRSHQDAALQELLARAPAHEAITRGSSLKFCLVAEGTADFYPRTGPTSEWDTAAGQCVVEQAGGAVWRLPGRAPLAYNTRESLLNDRFAVVGDPGHDWNPLLGPAR